jgi:hypothetical protein
LLHSLKQDLEPVGALEEILVEKIAQEYWWLGAAARYEADELARDTPFNAPGMTDAEIRQNSGRCGVLLERCGSRAASF